MRKIAKATGPRRKAPKPRFGHSPTPFVPPVGSHISPFYFGTYEELGPRRVKRKAAEEQHSHATKSARQSRIPKKVVPVINLGTPARPTGTWLKGVYGGDDGKITEI